MLGQNWYTSRTREVAVVSALVMGAAAYSSVASSIRPFTAPAEVVTAIPLALLLVVAAAQARFGRPLVLRRVGPRILDSDPAAGRRKARFNLGLWIWGALISALSLWEIGNLLAGYQVFTGSRHDHPTLSAFLDSMIQHQWTKAALFMLWLVFGAYLLRR